MTVGIDVVLHKQIVFYVGHFLSQIQVSRFELGLEYESFVPPVDLAIFVGPQTIASLRFQLFIPFYFLFGFDVFFRRRLSMAESLVCTVSILVHAYQGFYVQHIFVHERRSLIHKPVFSVEYFGIPGVDNVLNYVRKFIHLGLILIFTTLSRGFLSKLIFILPPFLSILTHHVLLADLIETFTHFAERLVLESEEFFQLHKLDVF